MFKSDKDSRLRYDSCNWQLADATSLKAWTTSRRLYFFKEALPEGARNIHHTYTPVTKHGVVLEGDAPWEIKSHVSSFCGSILRLDDMRFRLYYTIYNNKEMRMAVAESEDGIHWFRIPLGQEYRNGFNTNLIVLNGIPGEKTGVRYTGEVIAPDGRLDDNTGQLKYQSQVGGPQVLRLPDGGWRMYYWHHQEGWGRIPYIYTVAESKDGINWDVPDYERPVFISHFMGDQSELSKEEVLTEKAIRTNDSNYVYYNHNLGCYEQYSQFFLDSAAERQVKEDNCPDFNRMIQRRVSPEGLTWSAPELVIQADTQDPWDLQFYHLSVQYHEDWIIGSLGHYRVENSQQSMDIELVFSRNGRNWERPLRGGFIPRDPAGRDTEGIYPTNAWIDRGDSWLCLYMQYQLNIISIQAVASFLSLA